MTTRRALDAAEPARHALLGLLLDGPRHGYDLARSFSPDSVLGRVVHLSPSHLYALLARLERDGLIAGERQESESRPPRRVYRLSEAGRAAALRWAAEPVTRPRDTLLDFPLKLYVALRLDASHAQVLIARQRDLFQGYLHQLESAGSAPEGDAEATFIALLREGRVARTQAALTWLDRCAGAVSAWQARASAPIGAENPSTTLPGDQEWTTRPAPSGTMERETGAAPISPHQTSRCP